MEFLREVGLFVTDLIRAMSDPPVVTMVAIAERRGWLTSLAKVAVLGVWRLARGILDIILGTADITTYYLKTT